MNTSMLPDGIRITGELRPQFADILTPEALEFIAMLQRICNPKRKELLAARIQRQQEFDTGSMPDFLPETVSVRSEDWKVAPIPEDLQSRRIEITGPVERKMIVNALNSGANVFMADFEDANSPTWLNTIQGQINLRDAIRRTIDFVSPEGKEYKLNSTIATLLVRPRGWHLLEKHIMIDNEPMSASLCDFGLYMFHNAKELLARGSGPYFYLPKLESHREARLWNEVFTLAQSTLGIPYGSIKATVLIETITAAFEMEEILYELRDHAAGLNAGRWDYMFSIIKKFRNRMETPLPDRAQVTMTVPFMRAYTELLVKTCHKRGAHAIGGMAAFIPNRKDPAVTEVALARVRADKEREANDGFDGSWVAHPDLVAVAKEPFNEKLGDKPHQKERLRDDVYVSASDLLNFTVPNGKITEAGLRNNVNVAIQYIEAWLQGNGAVAIHNLMEDAATAEISRTQVWQWIHHPKGMLDDGRKVTVELVRQIIVEEMETIKRSVGTETFARGRFEEAREIFDQLATSPNYEEFLTLPAYERLA
ncbi:MAG: malate synthase A [Bacteroidota bacterium]|nr:malate synthase A [Candidatus Kapabacteria bacterium]MDW8219584.1 malate synthase A [Bacteroidota bacterium]